MRSQQQRGSGTPPPPPPSPFSPRVRPACPLARRYFSPQVRELQKKMEKGIVIALAANKGDRASRRKVESDAAAMYAPGMARTDSRISPLFGNLAALPPCLTIVSQTEVLLDDSRGLHRKLQALGLDSTCLEWKSTPHAFAVMPTLLPEARDALRQTADFIARVRRS